MPRPAAASSSMAAIAPGRVQIVVEPGPHYLQGACAAARRSPPLETVLRLLENGVRPVPRPTVALGEQRQADGGRIVTFFEKLMDEDEVAERLRHLLAAEAHHPHVHPMADEHRSGRSLRLGRLALVVREDEIGAAAVQVDGRAELAHGKRRALDVPTRAARAPERLPGRLFRCRRLPEHEVERVILERILRPAAALELRARSSRRVRDGSPGRIGGTTTRRSTRLRRHDRRGPSRGPCR